MKQIDYILPNREGKLELTASEETIESNVLQGCEYAYSCWKEQHQDEPLDEFIVLYLNDCPDICIVKWTCWRTVKPTYTELFDSFLDLTEMSLVKYPDGWGLYDRQGGNLGNIQNDRFHNATEILERMDSYIKDYIVEDLEDALENEDAKWEDWAELVEVAKILAHPDYDHDIDILDMICNHASEVDLNLAAHDTEDFSTRFDEEEDRKIETAVLKIKKETLLVFEAWMKEKPFHLRKHKVPKFGTVASWTVNFYMGIHADLKVCSGTEEDTLWTEMVLFDRNGTELACTDCEETLLEDWEIEYGGTVYRIKIEEDE